MNKMRTITIWIIVVAVILLAGWDVYALVAGKDATISTVLLESSKQYPIIPLCFGVLIGHLFFPQK